MTDDIYIKLRDHLNSMPAGYPTTESGAEINILKKFYTPEQATIALSINMVPETAVAIAERLDMDRQTAVKAIEKMASEGSLFRISRPDGSLYFHPNFIMGLYEWHVNAVDKEVAEYADNIYDNLFEQHWKERKTKQLRVVPVDTSIIAKDSVQGYDQIRSLVRGAGHGPYAMAPCICRVEKLQKGNEVNRPLETCFVFGLVAQYYIENGIGKALTEDELMAKLTECEEASLVPFSSNSKDISNMCMCDKDACQLLRNLGKFNKPATEVHAACYSVINEELCNGCKKCAKKCQIDAIYTHEDQADKKAKIHSVNLDRCICCGLCVSVCPQDAIVMNVKDIMPDVPDNTIAMNMQIAKERAELNI